MHHVRIAVALERVDADAVRIGVEVHHGLLFEVGVVVVGTQVEDVIAQGKFVADVEPVVPRLFAQVIAAEVEGAASREQIVHFLGHPSGAIALAGIETNHEVASG